MTIPNLTGFTKTLDNNEVNTRVKGEVITHTHILPALKLTLTSVKGGDKPIAKHKGWTRVDQHISRINFGNGMRGRTREDIRISAQERERILGFIKATRKVGRFFFPECPGIHVTGEGRIYKASGVKS